MGHFICISQDNQSQSDHTTSGVTRGPDQVQIPTSTVESLQETMPQPKGIY